MKVLQESKTARTRVFTLRRAKLLLCQNFHKKWRRRVAFSTTDASGLSYEVQCLKCGMKDTEVIQVHKTRVNA
jgi:hypothetical protein